jgi:CPA1 family monovalent cation:H+ antiporter
LLPRAIPLPLVQIALGALIAAKSSHGVDLEPDLFFLVFLPPLLFLDGWRIPKSGLLRDKGTILELAFGLVVFTVIGAGFLIHWLIRPCRCRWRLRWRPSSRRPIRSRSARSPPARRSRNA